MSLPSRRPPFRPTAELELPASAKSQMLFQPLTKAFLLRCFSVFSLYARDITCNSEPLQSCSLPFSFCFASCIYLCCHLYFLTFLCFECVHLKRWFGSRNLFSAILESHHIFFGFTARFCPRNCTNFVYALHDTVQLCLHLCEENWFLCLSVISVVALGVARAVHPWGASGLMQVSRKGINLTLYLLPVSIANRYEMWQLMAASAPGQAGPLAVTMMEASQVPVCVAHEPAIIPPLSVGASSALASAWRSPTAPGKLFLPLWKSFFCQCQSLNMYAPTVSLRRKKMGLIRKC